jgi:glycogen debranching enzyme
MQIPVMSDAFNQMEVQRTRLQKPSIQFGESLKEKIEAYEETVPDLLERQEPGQSPDPQKEILNTARKLRQALEHPEQLYTTKPPGQNIFFSTRNPEGWVIRGSSAAGSERPEGLFSYDMQHLDHLLLRADGQSPLRLLYQKKLDNPFQQEVGMEAQYEVPGNPNLHVFRKHQIDHKGQLQENFVFRNTGDQEQTFYLEAGSRGLDIFQARSLSNEADANGLRTKITHSANRKKSGSLALETVHQSLTPDRHELNPIQTQLTLNGQHENFQLIDSTTARLKIKVPAGEEIKTRLTVTPSNPRFPEAAGMPEKYSRTWDSFNSSVKLNMRNGNMEHLARMWEVAFDDLRTLTIPVQCGKATFYPCAAGIPNYVALFGRDSIVTALQTIQLNPMLARDTLATLAYYQGKKENAFTEEENGKICHELRLGETTRLGLSPHKPYYGSVDATPLFVILYNKYLSRTPDPTFARVTWPTPKIRFTDFWFSGIKCKMKRRGQPD